LRNRMRTQSSGRHPPTSPEGGARREAASNRRLRAVEWAQHHTDEALAEALSQRLRALLDRRADLDLTEDETAIAALRRMIHTLASLFPSTEALTVMHVPGWRWPEGEPLTFRGRFVMKSRDGQEPPVMELAFQVGGSAKVRFSVRVAADQHPPADWEQFDVEPVCIARPGFPDTALVWSIWCKECRWDVAHGKETRTLAGAICHRLNVTHAGGGDSALSVLRSGVGRDHRAVRLEVLSNDEASARVTRVPRWNDLATITPLEVVVVDGRPIVSDGHTPYVPREDRHRQQSFDFASRVRWIDGRETQDLILDALAAHPLDDCRSPLLGDVMVVCTLAAALADSVRLPIGLGAALIGQGRDSPTNRRRFKVACDVADSTKWRNLESGDSLKLAIAEQLSDDEMYLARPAWLRHRGPGQQWRPTGLLFRRLGAAVSARSHGGASARFTGMQRMVSGFESVLHGTPPKGGRHRDARTPTGLVPERPGGPGPGIAVDWRLAITRCGEHVPEGETPEGTVGRRYRKRVEALNAAGYGVGGDARDTIEIVEVRKGKGGDGPGLVIRATAEFCAAMRNPVRARVALNELPMLKFLLASA